MIDDLTQLLRRVLRGSDEVRALEAESARIRAAIASPADGALENDQRRLAARKDAVLLGQRLDVARSALRAALADLLTHMLVVGASGAGKTFLLLLLLLAAQAAGIPSLLIDPKAEIATLLIERLLPGLVARLPSAEADRLLRRLRVIDPFGRDHLPPLNPLARDASIPIEVQAIDVASCFEATVDAGSGPRMETILDWLLRLVIEVGGSFATVRRALQEPLVLDGLVRLCRDRDVVAYFLHRWPSEPSSSKLALLARIDRLLALPATRLALGARTCVSFDDALASGMTVMNLGAAPAGLGELATFWSTFLFTRVVRATYRRPATGANVPPAIVLVDEWQSCLTSPFARQMEDVLARARSRRVFFWLCNQQRAQVEKVSGALWDIVMGQTSIHALFRATIEDARAMRHMLPVTGRMPRPAPAPWAQASAPSPFLSPSEEIEARVHEVSRFPNRHAYWWDRRKPHAAVPFRTADLTLPDPRRVPTVIRESVARGAVAIAVAELERVRVAEAARLDQLARHGAPAPTSSPPPAGSPPRRGRKRRGQGNLPW